MKAVCETRCDLAKKEKLKRAFIVEERRRADQTQGKVEDVITGGGNTRGIRVFYEPSVIGDAASCNVPFALIWQAIM